MDGKDIESTLNLEVARVGSGVPEWANQIIRVVCFPVYLLMLGLEKLTGEEKWQREQYRRMVEERPPLSSDEFLSHFEPEIDHRLVLAVRHAFS